MSQKESKGWNDPPITAGTAPRKPFKRPKAPPHPLLRGQEGSSPAGSQNPPLPLARNLPPSEILSRLVPGVKNSSKEEDVSIGGNCNIEDKLENVSVKMSSSPDIKEELRNLLKEMSSDEDIDKNALLNLERLLQDDNECMVDPTEAIDHIVSNGKVPADLKAKLIELRRKFLKTIPA